MREVIDGRVWQRLLVEPEGKEGGRSCTRRPSIKTTNLITDRIPRMFFSFWLVCERYQVIKCVFPKSISDAWVLV